MDFDSANVVRECLQTTCSTALPAENEHCRSLANSTQQRDNLVDPFQPGFDIDRREFGPWVQQPARSIDPIVQFVELYKVKQRPSRS